MEEQVELILQKHICLVVALRQLELKQNYTMVHLGLHNQIWLMVEIMQVDQVYKAVV